ncbi:BLUF domain-containing protein [Planctomicrobium piriforme]|uniref:Sensors of blue-light using FAD n=1 Tax=Planctomicrobium piriforme TaxID=1576369 RepID=A0A1I3AVV2_9PLAN|nr:BLUF domain-containing protein [Planctomicrobium piriforme]SFH53879.1 Sensors of blue-light using FAD [Planctomicrobium piriforme]
MLQLIYKSAATVPLSSAELSRLLMKSRAHNDLCDLTGILMYHSNAFLQVLEGPDHAVEETFERIAADPRHKCLQVLRRQEIEERSFREWSMGFVCSYGRWLEEMPGFEEFFQRKGSFPREAGDQALRLLKEFRYSSRRRQVDLGYAPLMVR